MYQMTVTLEWDDDLGPRFLSKDKLTLKLKGDMSESLRVISVSFPDSSAKERAEEELQQLNQRLATLDKLPYGKFMEIEKDQRVLLADQYLSMTMYSQALRARIKAWTTK